MTTTYAGKYTIADNIRTHLQIPDVSIPTVYNLETIMDGVDNIQLPYTNVNSGSEAIKIQTTNTPVPDLLVLSGTSGVSPSPYIVPGSIVLASDAVMSTIYVENEDYVVNYTTGAISRASTGSSIPNPSTVYIWYIPFDVLLNGIDYSMDYSAGTIRRISGTSIPDGATVYIDLAYSIGTVTDDLIKLAITEANVFLQERMNQSDIDIINDGIEAIATYTALGIICNSSALRELNLRGDQSYRLAENWQEMAVQYFSLAENAFKKFSDSSHSFIPGGAIQNRTAHGEKKVKSNPPITPGTRRH